ncbi:MAG: hypothetical protein IT449_01800 [Phycisphaerales bacterium]|nr:hypothetical protein [Phycisphaerales bacterium]
MTSPPSTTSGFSRGEPGLTETARLLRLGLTEASRPVDDVIERLHRRDGAEWMRQALSSGPLALNEPGLNPPSGTMPVAQLRNCKEACKTLLHHATEVDARQRAILNYFICVAAALIQHRQRICSKGRAELDPILLDLAEAAPAPWSDWLGSAALVAESV